jgi:hypothetical protein
MSPSTLASQRHSTAPPLPPLVLSLSATAVAWGVLFAALPPAAQNFPLNDDWAFARGAFLFARGQGVHYSGWASMPQLGQWLWACPFLWLLGESHFALRLATIALSWLGLAAFHDLLRGQGVPPSRAALATAALAFTPLFFLLQGTFLTDVPALSLALLALALYGRALRRGSGGWLAGACAVAVLGALTRQNTLGAVGAAAVLLWREPLLRRRPLWWLGVLLPAAAGAAAHVWFQGREDVRPLTPSVPAPATLLALPFQVVHWCGLAALPLLLLEPGVRSWKAFTGALVLLSACAGYWYLYGGYLPYGGQFPYTENMVSPWGAFAGSRSTGPLVVGPRPLLLGTAERWLLTGLGCAAGAALVARAVRGWRPGDGARPLVLFTLWQFPFLLIVPDLYDRYFLFLLPGALVLAAGGEPGGGGGVASRPRWWAALAGAAAVAAVSVGLMHDWLAWNAARWALGRRALAHHIHPLDIEGGFEWDASYAPVGEEPAPGARRWPVLPFTRDWFPVVRGRYALSFADLAGARRVDAEPYTLWLWPGRHEFFLLEVPPLPAGH